MESPFTSSTSPFSAAPADPPRPQLTLGFFSELFAFLGSSVFLGLVYHFIARGYDLPLILPGLAGALIGYFIAQSARKYKVRSKTGLVLLSLVCGLLCFGTRHIADIVRARESMIRSASAQQAAGNLKLKLQIERKLRSQITPLAFIPLYVRSATNRRYISRSKRQGNDWKSFWGPPQHTAPYESPSPLWSAPAFYVLLALHTANALALIGAAVGVGAGITWPAVSKTAYCETCNERQSEDITIAYLYDDQATKAIDLLEQGDLAMLIPLLQDETHEAARDQQYTVLHLRKCSSCRGGSATLTATRDRRDETLWQSQVSPQEVVVLEEVREKWVEIEDAKAARDTLSTE